MSEFFIIESFINELETENILNFSLTNLNLEDSEVGPLNNKKINKYVRKSKVCFYDYFSEFPKLKIKLQETIYKFYKIKGFDINFDINFQFTEYKVGEFYDWHTDSSTTENGYSERFCSFVILLNDNYEGGFLEIIDSEKNMFTFPKKRGNLYLFPSHLLHRVDKVNVGIRYSLVGWFSLKNKNEQKTLF